MTKKLLLFLLSAISSTLTVFAQTTLDAYCIDMKAANVEDASTARAITCDTTTIEVSFKMGALVRKENRTQYTFHNVLEQGYDVVFYCHNDGNANNITFQNGTEAADSPFTTYLPGSTPFLTAVYGHYDYTSAFTTFDTHYSQGKQEGCIVILDGSRNKVKRVVKFGLGKYAEEVIEEVANIAEFKSKAKASKLDLGNNDVAQVYTITGPLTFVQFTLGQSWAYVQDETGSLAIYLNHSYPLGSMNYQKGDVIRGATGFSVGNADGGAYMDLEAERFYVRTPDHEGEHTVFPARGIETSAVIAPKVISDVSAITDSDEYTYVVLAGCTFEKKVDATDDPTDVHPNRIRDAQGHTINLTLSLFDHYDENTKKEWNTFEDNVPNGYKGNYIGFLNNLNKNLVIFEWNNKTIEDEDAISSVLSRPTTTDGIFLRDGEIIIRRGGKTYSPSGKVKSEK